MRSRLKILTDDGIYFVTSTIINWIPVFSSDKYYSIIIDALNFYKRNKDLKIYSYVILDNHFHLIVSHKDLSLIMQSFKKYSAKMIINNLQDEGKIEILKIFEKERRMYQDRNYHKVWQDSFYPKEIASIEILRQKIEYIHLNPVRKGFVNNAIDWKYSSAIDYLSEKKGLIEIDRTLM